MAGDKIDYTADDVARHLAVEHLLTVLLTESAVRFSWERGVAGPDGARLMRDAFVGQINDVAQYGALRPLIARNVGRLMDAVVQNLETARELGLDHGGPQG